jgi:hypothetical protein
MSQFTIAVIAVAVERLLVVGAGLISILLGWNLFVRAIIPNQSGTIAVGEWKVELKTVGPGIFFSLFGTVILVYVLINPAKYTTTVSDAATGPVTITAMGVRSASDTITFSYARAINTISQIDTQLAALPEGSVATVTPTQRKDLNSASSRLKQLRRQILVSNFGASPIDEWEANQNIYLTSKQQLPLDLRQRLEKIAPWFIQNVTDEGESR